MKKIIQNSEGLDAPKPLSAVVVDGAVYSLTIAENVVEEERYVPDGFPTGTQEVANTQKVWTWQETVFEQIKLRSYSALVSFLVRAKYSADDVEAAHCNAAEGNTADIDAVNAWRGTIKPFARTVFPEG